MTTPRLTLRGAADVLLPPLGLAGATLLAGLGAPVVLRALVALPVLALVAGSSATRLLLGARVASTPPAAAPEPDATGAPGGVVGTAQDGLLRGALAVVLGTVVLLASILLSQAAGVPVAGPSVLLGVAGAAVVLLLASRLRRTGASASDRGPGERTWLRPVLGTVATTAVLGAAVALAATFPTPVVERYTLLTFTGAQPYSATSLSAAPASTVILDVALSSYGQPLDPGAPPTALTVAGSPASGLQVRWQPVQDGLGGTDEGVPTAVQQRTGRLAFRAPRDPGLYPVRLSTSGAGTDPQLLTTYLQVTS